MGWGENPLSAATGTTGRGVEMRSGPAGLVRRAVAVFINAESDFKHSIYTLRLGIRGKSECLCVLSELEIIENALVGFHQSSLTLFQMPSLSRQRVNSARSGAADGFVIVSSYWRQ